MVDIEFVKFIIKEIKECKNVPFEMANKKLVDEFLPEIKKEIPQIEVYEIDSRQWFVMTKTAKKKLALQLNKEIERHREKASSLSKVIESINRDEHKSEKVRQTDQER